MRLKKILTSTLFALAITIGTLAPSTSTMAAKSQVIEIDDIEDTSDEETVVLPEKEYEPYEEMDYNLNIVSKEDWENTDIGEYPIDVSSTEWKHLSFSEAVAACNMPKEYAKSLTTEELVDYALNYPFIMDILCFDSIADGMNSLKNRSAVFEELFSRSDCFDELLAEYLNMKIDYIELTKYNDICGTKYDSELFIEVYLGLNYDLLSDVQAEKFVEEYSNKYSNMNNECQEGAFSTLVYAAIEEKLGVIPESAVPENVADKLVVPADISDISLMSIDSITCGECGASLTPTTITVNGRTVYCYQWLSGGYTANEIADLDKYFGELHPTFSKVRSASSKYNCHSYAWYSTESSNVYWIEAPANIFNNTNYWTPWSVPMRALQSGDRITFYSNGKLMHSAIVNSSTQCTSKLGHCGVYKTTITEMKTMYGSTTQAYVPK